MGHRAKILAVAVISVVVVSGLSGCQPKTARYVALGDSYTAGPLIPKQTLEPLGCLRSDHDYPSLIGANLNEPVKDVSCSGADTADMFAAQGVTPGPNPAQLDALDANVKVVTLQIGGNDIGFSSIVKTCIKLNPFDAPCRDTYVTGAGDQLANNIANTKPKLAAVIKEIHKRAPKAKVLVAGYPTVLPATGNGCWPAVPILPADVTYLRGVYTGLNSMIKAAASENGATYVDLATSTVGHDACSNDKWVEGVIPAELKAAPVHPNLKGMIAAVAVLQPKVQAALNS